MENKHRQQLEKKNRDKDPGVTLNEALRHGFIGSPQGGCFSFLTLLLIVMLIIFIHYLVN